MADTMMGADTTPYETELRKATAECGWTDLSEKAVLLRFVARQGQLRPTLLSEFRDFLKAASREEEELAATYPVPYHGARASDEDEEDEDDDEDDSDLGDDEGDFDDDDLDDDFDDSFDDDLDDDEDDDEDDDDDDEEDDDED
jgi:hypothetical protein